MESFASVQEALEKKQGGFRLRGWVYRHRVTKNAVFVLLRDSTGVIQCVFKPDNPDFQKASDLYIESSVIIEGEVRPDERAPGGAELKAEKLEVVCNREPFVITKDQSTEFLMDVRHLSVRAQKITRAMIAREKMMKYFREFFEKEGFHEVFPPIFTVAGAEGGATLFEVPYFGKKVYLSQSAQLYLEALIFSLEKVYSLTPSFRAEKSHTSKHLTEYWHLEAEMAWWDQEKNMDFQERMISYVCQKMAENEKALLEYFGRDPADLKKVEPPFPRMSYDEAIEELQKKGFDIEYGDDPGAPHEEALTKDLDKPLFIHSFPEDMKAFYMQPDEKNPGKVKAADMLAPKGHGEIIGGSERIWDKDLLEKKIKEFGLDPKAYEWYVDLRRYGSVPHSGFGLGTERTLKWILDLPHIRDVVPFPRTVNRYYP